MNDCQKKCRRQIHSVVKKSDINFELKHRQQSNRYLIFKQLNEGSLNARSESSSNAKWMQSRNSL